MKTIDEALGGYNGLNEGFHRKATAVVGHPSLTQFLGFWRKAGLSDEHRYRELRQYFHNLRRVIETNFAFREAPDFGIFADDMPQNPGGHASGMRHKVVMFEFRWRGHAATVRFEINNEFIACTSIIDLSLRPVDNSGLPLQGYQNSQHFKRILDNLGKAVADSQSVSSDDREKAHDALYRTIWSHFRRDVLNADFDGEKILCSHLGDVFADFRGLITGDAHVEKNGILRADRTQLFRPPFVMGDRFNRGRTRNYDKADAKWAEAVAEGAWPFVLAKARRAELAVSRYLGGRALYITALGPEIVADVRLGKGRQKQWSPVCYFLHMHTDDEWQIGRLIDRIHYVGCMRLAAVIQFDQLYKVNLGLADIEIRIERIRRLIQLTIRAQGMPSADAQGAPHPPLQVALDTLIQSTKHNRENLLVNREVTGDPAVVAALDHACQVIGHTPNDNQIKKAHEIIRAALADVSILIEGMEKPFPGGVQERIDKAKYYIGQFSGSCEDLRARRLEGYQTYQQFVLRRIGSSFDIIDALAARTRIYRENLGLLHGSYMSLDLSRATREIQILNGSIRERESAIEDIQDVGEIVLFAVIAPHYLVEMLKHLVEDNTWVEHSFPVITEATVMPVALLFFALIGFGRLYKQLHERLKRHPLFGGKVRFADVCGFLWPGSKRSLTPPLRKLRGNFRAKFATFVVLLVLPVLVYIPQFIAKSLEPSPAHSGPKPKPVPDHRQAQER